MSRRKFWQPGVSQRLRRLASRFYVYQLIGEDSRELLERSKPRYRCDGEQVDLPAAADDCLFFGRVSVFVVMEHGLLSLSTMDATPFNIPFNKPFIAGKELYYIAQAVTMGQLSGDGHFTRKCADFLRDKFGSHEVLMTPSCTAALELAAMLCDFQPGDEVIMPSYTFVSTASAFVREGAHPVFVDIRPDTLNLDESLIEDAITDRTRAIVPVHYAGVGCEMDRIMAIAERHDLVVIEDAAQAVNSRFNNKYLGAIGHLGCYSFHETKNYICGEGGALAINDDRFLKRARILRDKGTNRHEFMHGNVDKYTWVDIGSSYVPSELCCAFLWAQLEQVDTIAEQRREIYQRYRSELRSLEVDGLLRLPHIPEDCDSNFHMFYILLPAAELRADLLSHLKSQGIHGVFHFVPLHSSPMGQQFAVERTLPVTDNLAARVVRLPFFYTMTQDEQQRVVESVSTYLRGHARIAQLAAGQQPQNSPIELIEQGG